MSDSRIHALAVLFLALGAAACAAHHEQDGSSVDPMKDPPVLAGEYTAASGGDVATIGFYGSEYALRPSSCGADDAACVVHGTYRVDAAANTLALHPNGSATETVWPLRFDPRAVQAAGTAVQTLHPLLTGGTYDSAHDPLVGKQSCLLTGAVADSFTADGVTYSQASTTSDFEKSVIGKPGGAVNPAADSFANNQWFQIEDKGAAWSCAGAPDGLSPRSNVVMWHTVQLVDVVGCNPANSGWSQSHSYYMTDGTPIASYDDGTKKTNYEMTPLAVLMKVMGKCR
jgi:hypothetical protein